AASQKSDLPADSEIFRQSGEAIAIGAFADHLALQLRALKPGDGGQHQLMAFSCQQIADDQDGFSVVGSRTTCGKARSKKSGVRAVVDDLSMHRCIGLFRERLLYLLADADHFARALIGVD